MNTSIADPPVNDRRLTPGQTRERRETGQYYLALDHIPKGCRQEAILAVNAYLFGLRITPEQRLERLAEWYFARRPARYPREFEREMSNLRTAVYWQSKWTKKGARKGQFEYLADETVDRLIGYGMLIQDFMRANEKRFNAARKKIEQGLNWILGCMPNRPITRHLLERVTGCHKNTINKHSDIWKAYVQGGAGVYCAAKEEVPVATRARVYDIASIPSAKLPEAKKDKPPEQQTPSDRGVITVRPEGVSRADKATIFEEVRKVLRNKSAFINPRISLARAAPLLKS